MGPSLAWYKQEYRQVKV